MKIKALYSLVLLFVTTSLYAQDTLPNFSVKNAGNNRIVIGWNNQFENIRQISIQRSFDSLKNYKTILTVADPTTPQNGFVDTKATNDHMFYRLYILLDKGVYLFSDAKKPVLDTAKVEEREPFKPAVDTPVVLVDSLGRVIDTISKVNKKPVVPSFVPSKYIYTYKDGYVRISLPDDAAKKYLIKFFDADNNLLFELKDFTDRSFKLEKSNFYKAGWYFFELYENGELLEKHKFLLTKDF
jgi:hypothetical protein